MKHRLFLSALLSFLLLQLEGSAQSETKPVLSLKDCIQFSLANHPSHTVYTNDVEAARKKQTEAIASYLPQVNGTGTFDDNLKRQVTIIPAGAFSPTDIKVQFGVKYTTNVYAQVDQTIYDQSLINGIKAAGPNLEIARLQKQKNDEQLIYNTASAYYQCMIQAEQMRLLALNEKTLAEVLDIQKQQYEKGLIKKVDYDRVRVNYNNTKAQQEVSALNYRMALNQLKNAMGIPVDNEIRIVDTLDYSKIVTKADVQNTDIRNTADYRIQSQNMLLMEIDLKRKRSGAFPTLNAYGRYGAQALNNDFNDQYKNWFDYSVVGLRLNVPLFSGLKRSSQVKQSELSLYNAKENFKITTNSLQLAVLNSNTALASSYNTFMSSKENLELAKSVFDNTSLQYQRGVSSLSDLLNSEYSYKEAQSNYINSLVKYLISRMDLERSKGNLTQYINQL